jgi:hypothetical protein
VILPGVREEIRPDVKPGRTRAAESSQALRLSAVLRPLAARACRDRLFIERRVLG